MAEQGNIWWYSPQPSLTLTTTSTVGGGGGSRRNRIHRLVPTRSRRRRQSCHVSTRPLRISVVVLWCCCCLFISLARAEKLPPSGTTSSPSTTALTPRQTHNGVDKETQDASSDSTSLSQSKDALVRTQAPQEVVQIVETEIWDGAKWKGATEHARWTNLVDDEPCPSPDRYVPPPDYQFEGDWKIVTGGTARDVYGWEYTVAQPYPIRQRVWLRNLERVTVVPTTLTEVIKIRKKPPSSAVSQKKQKQRRRRQSTLPWIRLPTRWVRAIRDDFNFKGFGMSLYKSVVFPKSFGATLRLPLTYNFGRWETNPGLPSVSTSVGLFFPGTAMISISTSIRVEFLKYFFARTVEISVYILVAVVWQVLVRGLVLAFSALLFPITRQLYQPSIPLRSPWAIPRKTVPVYSRTVQERLGCSVSWRVSRSRGYEFRVSYWHYYAYTLSELWPRIQAIMNSLLLNMDEANNSGMPDWWARRKAAFGLSTSAPLPYEPYVTGSLSMSLSGYYFKPAQKVRLVTSPSSTSSIASTAASPTTTTAAIRSSPVVPKKVVVKNMTDDDDIVGDDSTVDEDDEASSAAIASSLSQPTKKTTVSST